MTKKEKFAQDLGKCAGKWVAATDDHVIACADTIKEVREKATEANIKDPVIFQVPAGEGYSFF